MVTLDEEVLRVAKVRADAGRRGSGAAPSGPSGPGKDGRRCSRVAASRATAHLRRRDHLDPVARSCLCQADVVGNDTLKVVSEVEGRREVQRVQAAQVRGVEEAGALEDVGGDREQRDGLEQRACTSECQASRPPGDSHELAAEQVARGEFAAPRPAPQRRRLGLPHHELRRRRGVEVESGQDRSCSRMASRSSVSEGPSPARSRGGPSSASGRVGSRSAPETRSSSSCPQAMGTSRATGRPRSVTVTISPAAARAKTFEACCLSSRMPTVGISFVVAQRWRPGADEPKSPRHPPERPRAVPEDPDDDCLVALACAVVNLHLASLAAQGGSSPLAAPPDVRSTAIWPATNGASLREPRAEMLRGATR
jgi:hypothetical protein